ncbi:MAG: NifU family protein [Erysipelotrichaceae bacterium]|nr:NifU family protein [Erysipelotrichaceae bacterium]
MNQFEMEKEVVKVIHKLRPYLQRDGGDIEFVKLEDGIVYVQMFGACMGCSLIDVTLKDGVEQILIEEVPGVMEVKLV